MQAGGSANNGVVHIGTFAAVCTVAVILRQTIQIQLKVRNCDLQVGKHTIIGFQRHTIIGYGYIDSNGGLVSLVIAVLLLNAFVGRANG